jgi:hypothetical protein
MTGQNTIAHYFSGIDIDNSSDIDKLSFIFDVGEIARPDMIRVFGGVVQVNKFTHILESK